MGFGHVLQALWAGLFIWYVIERLHVAKGLAPEPPLWRNPVAAARRCLEALRADARAARLVLALIVGGSLVTWAAGAAWWRFSSAAAADAASERAGRLVDAQPADFAELLFSRHLWDTTWRELLDAATLYPVFALSAPARAPAALALIALLVWALRRRDLTGPMHRLAPAHVRDAGGCLAVAAVALAVVAVANIPSAGRMDDDAQAFATLLTLLWAPVVQGGFLGLLALGMVDLVRGLPLDGLSIARRWLRLLPGFAVLAALVILPGALAELAMPGWERGNSGEGPRAAAHLITRLAWLAVLPALLWMASARRPPSEALRATGRFWAEHGKATAGALARAVVPLAPLLVALRLLETLAPATSLLPGLITLCATWALGLAVLGAAVVVYETQVVD